MKGVDSKTQTNQTIGPRSCVGCAAAAAASPQKSTKLLHSDLKKQIKPKEREKEIDTKASKKCVTIRRNDRAYKNVRLRFVCAALRCARGAFFSSSCFFDSSRLVGIEVRGSSGH